MFNLIDSIKEDEGLKLLPYTDSKGNLTIGYGHDLEFGITLQEADGILICDIQTAMAYIAKELPWIFNIVPIEKYNALIELTFWIGIGSINPPKGVLSFQEMLAALKKGDWSAAAAELMDSELGRNFTDRTKKLAKVISG